MDGFWFGISNLIQEEAHPAVRMQHLYRDGFFDLDGDLRRFERPGDGSRGADALEKETS